MRPLIVRGKKDEQRRVTIPRDMELSPTKGSGSPPEDIVYVMSANEYRELSEKTEIIMDILHTVVTARGITNKVRRFVESCMNEVEKISDVAGNKDKKRKPSCINMRKNIFRCPECHSILNSVGDETLYLCPACENIYSIKDLSFYACRHEVIK